MPELSPIRVILIDDHSKIHIALGALLHTLDDIELVAQGSDGTEAIHLCAEHEPDIVLMDVIMPGMSGAEATAQILEEFPNIKVIALSGFKDTESVQAMLNAGAIGYVLKTSSGQDIANTIRSAYAGNIILSGEVAQTLLLAQTKQSVAVSESFNLTPREREVLQLVVEGLNNTEIAEALTISLSTVRFHVTGIFKKLNVSNRVEATALAIQKNILG